MGWFGWPDHVSVAKARACFTIKRPWRQYTDMLARRKRITAEWSWVFTLQPITSRQQIVRPQLTCVLFCYRCTGLGWIGPHTARPIWLTYGWRFQDLRTCWNVSLVLGLKRGFSHGSITCNPPLRISRCLGIPRFFCRSEPCPAYCCHFFLSKVATSYQGPRRYPWIPYNY